MKTDLIPPQKSHLLPDNQCQLLWLPTFINFTFISAVSFMLRGHKEHYSFYHKDVFVILGTGAGTCPHIRNIRTGEEHYLTSSAFYEVVRSFVPLTTDEEGRIIIKIN